MEGQEFSKAAVMFSLLVVMRRATVLSGCVLRWVRRLGEFLARGIFRLAVTLSQGARCGQEGIRKKLTTANRETLRLGRAICVSLAVGLLAGPLAGPARGSFTLTGSQHLDVTTGHATGTLYDTSSVAVLPGGQVTSLKSYGSSTISMAGGQATAITSYDSSKVSMTGGGATTFYSYGSSTVSMAGGQTAAISSYDSSTVAMTGGQATTFYSYGASSVDFVGGKVGTVQLKDSSDANVTGGEASSFRLYDTAHVTMSGGKAGAYFDLHDQSTAMIQGGTIRQVTADLDYHGPLRVTISGSADVHEVRSTLHVRGVSQVTYNEFPSEAALAAHGMNITPGTVDLFSQNLAAHDTSGVKVTGGELYALLAQDSSVVEVAGGDLNAFTVSGSATGLLNGGQVYHVQVQNNSHVTMSAGNVKSFFTVSGQGTATIQGGTASSVTVLDLAWQGPQRVTITGSANVNSLRATFSFRGTSSITYNETPTAATLAAHGVNITTGTVGIISQDITAFETSAVTVTGGKLGRLTARDHSVVTVTGGELSSLVPDSYSVVTMTGGQVGMLETRTTSATDVWGGEVVTVRAMQGTLTIHGKDFSLGSGLSLSGDKLLGKGVLGGKWLDGTPWTININYNGSAANILLVPEPCSAMLLALGAVAVIRRRRR